MGVNQCPKEKRLAIPPNSKLSMNEHPLPVHPGPSRHLRYPNLKGWDTAKIFPHMLLANIPNGNVPAVAVHNGVAEEPFGQEDALCMVAEGSMTKVRDLPFRFVEEVVDGLGSLPACRRTSERLTLHVRLDEPSMLLRQVINAIDGKEVRLVGDLPRLHLQPKLAAAPIAIFIALRGKFRL